MNIRARKKRPWHDGQRLIRVDFKAGEAGLIYGTSRDCPGLLVAEPTLEMAVKRAPEMILDLYLAMGKKIKRCLIASKHAWIFLPMEMNRNAHDALRSGRPQGEEK